MSENDMFQREIKRSGYLRGTQMKKVRSRIITAAIVMTVGSYALGYYFWEPDKDRVYKTNLKERQWTEERAQRLRETIELKKRLLADKEGKGE